MRRWLRALGLQAAGGLVVWAVVAAAAWNVDSAALDIVTVLLLFAQLVIVPMGMLLVTGGPLIRGARYLFRIGAVAALVSLAIPRGEVAAAVAALYLLPALIVGGASLLRASRGIADGSLWRPTEMAEIGAGGFLAVGALFFVLQRQDVAFAGFPELAVHMTAVHFHYIGFGLLLMAGELARRRPPIGGVAVYLLVAGVILMPIGLMTHPLVQAFGALLVVAALFTVSAATFGVLGRAGLTAGARRLLFVSAVFPVMVGGMAAAYAIGEVGGSAPIPVELMARMHGVFAAFGVILCGLLGWRLAGDS